jgi:hypothetical protein
MLEVLPEFHMVSQKSSAFSGTVAIVLSIQNADLHMKKCWHVSLLEDVQEWNANSGMMQAQTSSLF